MHGAREFGALLHPPLTRELTAPEAQAVLEALLLPPGAVFPPADRDVHAFLRAVKTAADPPRPGPRGRPNGGGSGGGSGGGGLQAYCPVRQSLRPWVDADAVAQYRPDQIRPLLAAHDRTLWRLFAFYATNATAVRVSASGCVPDVAMLRPLPTYSSEGGKHERKLLYQGDFWQMLEDAKLVPGVVNTVRFNKLVAAAAVDEEDGGHDQHSATNNSFSSSSSSSSSGGGGNRTPSGSDSGIANAATSGSGSKAGTTLPVPVGTAMLSYREYLRVLVGVAQGVAVPEREKGLGLSREQRLLRLLTLIEQVPRRRLAQLRPVR